MLLWSVGFLSAVLVGGNGNGEVYPDGISAVGSCRWKRLTEQTCGLVLPIELPVSSVG